MLRNYFKIALRNLWRHKTFTVINTVGLAVAFGATYLLSLTAFHELSFDKFHENKKSLYQVYISSNRPGGGVENGTSLPIPLTPALRKEFPDLAASSRFGSTGNTILRYKGHEFNYDIRAVDPDFLSMFTFPLQEGNPRQALAGQGNIVLNQSSVRAIFGQEDPLGQLVEVNMNGQWLPFTVSGVTKDVPDNSSIGFTALIRFENFGAYKSDQNNWDNQNHEAFVQLSSSSDQAGFEKKLKAFVHKYYDGTLKQLKRDGVQPSKDGEYLHIRLLPIADMHFSPFEQGATINKLYPYLLLVISAFILFIASTNFVNLSLGRAFTRAREIGMRKVLGAGRWQILVQFWGEALLISGIALCLGLLLAYMLLPSYKVQFHQQVAAEVMHSPYFLLSFFIGFILVSTLAGGYPAWVLSALKTSLTVKGRIGVTKKNRLRTGLMMVQFVLSGLLIICTTIVWQQLNYLRSAPLGYDKQQILSIPVGSHIEGDKALTQLRSGLAGLPDILSVSGSDMNMGRGLDGSSSTSIMGFDYKGKTVSTHWMGIGYDYVQTLGLQIVTGRDFSRDYSLDSNAVLINEKMAAVLGDKDPLTASLPIGEGHHFRVIGVVKDFHFRSLHEEIKPLTMVIGNGLPIEYIFVKVAPTHLPASLAAVARVWKHINPAAESDISFLDENTDRQYRKEERLSKIFISGATLTILISCMGLLAIVVLVLSQRTKEIGIRKVLGASATNIFTLVSREFLPPVALSFLIASPIAWWAMHQWLQDFPYRIHIGIEVFLLAAAVTLSIALLTVSLQVFRAARANPVDNLKTE